MTYFKKYDRIVDLPSSSIEDTTRQLENDFVLFYEHWPSKRQPIPFVKALLLTAAVFALHFSATAIDPKKDIKDIFSDFSLLLPLLIGTGCFLLLTATRLLRRFLVHLINISKQPNRTAQNKFMALFERDLSGWHVLAYALGFGFGNAFVGWIFGIPYFADGAYLAGVNFLIQLFVIGFIGGITCCSVVLVYKLCLRFDLKEDFGLSYFYPDSCGGTLILGNILFWFSFHFIISGAFIFIFIHLFPWTNVHEDYSFIYWLNITWKLFPFALSALIFFLPASRIHTLLRDYKLYERHRTRIRMSAIAEEILEMDVKLDNQSRLEMLEKHYVKLKEIDDAISSMNTWPYHIRYRAIFLGFFLPGISALLAEVSQRFLSDLVYPAK